MFKNSLKREDYEVCDECKGLFVKGKLQKVVINDGISWYPITSLYCKTHEKPYSEVYYLTVPPYEHFYYKKVECDVNGKVLKSN